jgi:hypothetical protein
MTLLFGSLVLFSFISSSTTIRSTKSGPGTTTSNLTSCNGCSIKFLDTVHTSAKLFGSNPSSSANHRFSFYHQEKIASAIERYVNEAKRVLGVLDKHLSDPKNKGWLAGGRYTIADIGFIAWGNILEKLPIKLAEFPAVDDWLKRMLARPAIKAGYKGGPFEIKE